VLGLLAGLPRTNYWTLAEHELQHLVVALVIRPAATQGTGRAGWCGDADIRHAPWPATHQRQATQDHEGHELRLEY
jgi:hypothetical protein